MLEISKEYFFNYINLERNIKTSSVNIKNTVKISAKEDVNDNLKKLVILV